MKGENVCVWFDPKNREEKHHGHVHIPYCENLLSGSASGSGSGIRLSKTGSIGFGCASKSGGSTSLILGRGFVTPNPKLLTAKLRVREQIHVLE